MAEYRVQVLEDILRRLHKSVDGLHGTVVVSIEGFVVAAYSGEGRSRTSNPVDSPQIAAMAAAIIALGERVLGRLARGGSIASCWTAPRWHRRGACRTGGGAGGDGQQGRKIGTGHAAAALGA
jgi:hypothetical protein